MKRRKNAIRIRANFRSQRSLFSRTVLVEGAVGGATTEGGRWGLRGVALERKGRGGPRAAAYPASQRREL